MEVGKFMDRVRAQVGIKENPPGSNKVLYNTWYYGKEVSGSSYPWCMTFCQWCYAMSKVSLPIRTASCTELMNAAKKAGNWVTKDYRPGDLIIFTFNKNRTPQHCGIVEKADRGSIVSIEGNTSLTSDDNGGSVMRRTRSLSTVLGAFRPVFEEGIDMTVDEFIAKLTPKQAYEIQKKAEGYSDTLVLPTWARTEGYWKAMKDAGFIKNDTPEGHVKRDELASILGRMGLIK